MNSHQNTTAMAAGASPVGSPSILSLYRIWDAEYERINRKGARCIAYEWADSIRDEALAMLAECDRPDPLIAAINNYHAGIAAYDGSVDYETSEDEQAAIATTYGPPLEILAKWDKPAITQAGAVEALRFAANGSNIIGLDIQENMVRAALSYFERDGGGMLAEGSLSDSFVATGVGQVLSEMLNASENALTAINEHDGADFNSPVLKTLCERRCQLALSICGHRPLSMAEQRAKAEFLRDWTESTPLTEEEQNALIASLMPKGGEA
jgi:hypothetical protein